MSAVTADDLDWVTFSSDEGEVCGVESVQCAAEAVAVAWFRTTCQCGPRRLPLCTGHRDALIRLAAERTPGALRCMVCDSPGWLLRIEPIR